MNFVKKTAAATALVVGTATAAFGGCVGQPYNNDVSLEQNAYNAGLAAIVGHRRNASSRLWDNRQRAFEPNLGLPESAGAPAIVNLSGHGFPRAVRECERFRGTESRADIFNDIMALTCNGRRAYVQTPDGSLFVVDRRTVTQTTGSQMRCDR